MNKGWHTFRLKDVAKILYGPKLIKKDRVSGEYPVYGSSGIVDKNKKYFIKGPGLIIGRKGSVGKVYFEAGNFYPIDTTYYITETKNCDLRYLYYLLNYSKLNQLNDGSAVPGINREELYNQEYLFPPLHQQEKIASLLWSFDTKIEVNNQINSIIEKICQAIFKLWFIDLIPFRDKIIVKSNIGLTQSEWERDLREFVSFTEGPNIKTIQYCNEGIPLLNIKSISDGKINFSSVNYINTDEVYNKYKRFLLEEGDYVFSSSGTLGKIAKIREDDMPLLLNAGIIRFRTSNNMCGKNFLKYFLQSDLFRQQITKAASGSVQLNFGPTHLSKMKIIIPSKEWMEKFEHIATLVEQVIDSNIDENKTLLKIRDVLISQLLSGKRSINIH